MKKYLFPFFFLILFFTACDDLEGNLQKARTIIEMSKAIGAPQYAAEPLAKAEKHYADAMKQKETDKKMANTSALTSITNAKIAYLQTLREMPEKEKQLTEEKKTASEEASAPILSPEIYSNALLKYEESLKINEDIQKLKAELEKTEQEAVKK